MYEDKYLNRIIPQHKIQPKYMAWLAALLDKLQDLSDVVQQIDSSFDLDNAAGIQLDTIGQLVGVNRLLNFEPQYAPSALLSDDDYRFIIRARISLNQWDGTTAGIKALWNQFFSSHEMQVVDNQDMTVLIRVFEMDLPFEREIISKGYFAPKPEGVLMNYVFIIRIPLAFSNTPRFLLNALRVKSRFNNIPGDPILLDGDHLLDGLWRLDQAIPEITFSIFAVGLSAQQQYSMTVSVTTT